MSRDIQRLVDEATQLVESKRGRSVESHWEGAVEPINKSAREEYTEGYQPFLVWKSFGDYLRDGLSNHRSSDFSGRIQKAVQGMSTVVGADGGFGVLPEFSKKIMDRPVTMPDLMSMTDRYTVAGNNMTFPRNAETSRVDGSRAGGLQSYWVGQGDTITSSKPALGQFTLQLKKLAVVCYLTQELIEDNGTALEQYVTRKVGEEFAFKLNDAIINGTGGAMPLGILSSPALVTITKKSGQTAATYVAENAVGMWARLYAPYRSNAVWLYNQQVDTQLPLMTIGSGTVQAAYLPPGGLSGNQYGTLFGRPMMPIEAAQALGTAGDVVLADLSQYVTISKGSVVQSQSMHVEFLTDQLALKFTMRVDGAPWQPAALTPKNGSATLSPFVCVETRS